jgi:hypothetical protein
MSPIVPTRSQKNRSVELPFHFRAVGIEIAGLIYPGMVEAVFWISAAAVDHFSNVCTSAAGE